MLINMVVPGVGFVNLPSNQRVTGVYVYTVSMMNSHLWDKRLIPLKFPQAPRVHPA